MKGIIIMNGWEEIVRKVTPYVPGEQPRKADVIKLNTNENPYPPSPKVAEVLRAFDAGRLRKYPDPESSALVSALAEAYDVNRDQIFVGVGSDDVLAMSFLTFFGSHRPVLFADITYSFYPVWCELFGIPFETPALDDEFRWRKEDYFGDNGGIVIANPNAPTGIAADLSDIEEVVAHNPDVVCIVDEAYVDFGGESALPLVGRYENLLVVRTFSKSRSLAGSRIGFAFGSRKLISYLNDAKFSFNSYTMDAVTQEIGVAALSDESYFNNTVGRIVATRGRAEKLLWELGFTVLPSSANFLFATHPTFPADELFAMLKEKGIFVRYFKSPRIDDYLRITVGTDEEMEALAAALREYMG